MTMASIVDQMTAVYVFLDDYLQAHPTHAHWRRSPHGDPSFTDAEVLTIALLQGCLGVSTLKQAYQFVAANQPAAFPHLPSYSQWLARLHALSGLTGRLLQAAARCGLLHERLYLLDSKPIPVCKPIRHGRVRLLRDEGAYFGKTRCGWFFGFKLHALAHHSGGILAVVLTPGNWPDQDVALSLAWSVAGGIALADLAYRAPELAQTLWEEAGLLLLTPAAAGENRPQRALISSVRERIETTFSALWAHFIDRIFSRSWEGLWSTLKLKLLHHNLCLAGIIPR
jgi:transposase